MARRLSQKEKERRALMREYSQVARKWEKAHAKYWDRYAPKPFVAAGRESDMTAGQYGQMRYQGARFWGNPTASVKKAEEYESAYQMKKAIAAMKAELSPSFQKRRASALRGHARDFAGAIGDDELTRLIESLTDAQLEELNNTTDFFARFNQWYDPDMNRMEKQQFIDSLKETIGAIVAKSAPKESAQQQRREKAIAKSQKFEKRLTGYNEQVAARGTTREEKIEQLKRYGVAPLMNTDPEWYLAYL